MIDEAAGSTSKFEILPRSSRSSLSNGGKVSIGFDLNNGPGLDELGTDTAPRSLPVRSNFPFAATAPGVRMNTTEYGNLSSWFSQGGSYSGISVPSLLPGRREQIVVAAPPAGSSSFGPEMLYQKLNNLEWFIYIFFLQFFVESKYGTKIPMYFAIALQIDEAAGSTSKFEILPRSSRSSLSNGGKVSIGFDLNNGPGLDELGTDTAPRSLPVRSNFPFAATAPGVRMNTTEYGNLSSWFSQGGSYSGISVPSLLPGRREQIVVAAPPAGSSSFGPEMYRGPVLSSSPAVTFSSATAFQYQGFPFETSFPLLSTSFPGSSASYLESSSGNALCFPTNPSQMVGPFPRPYIMSLPGSTGHVGAENRNWGSLPLDLNAGPSGTDAERRDQRLPSGLRQMSVPSSLALTEEQMKMYQATNGVFKRKEPDGGWDGADRFGYKHPPWQ